MNYRKLYFLLLIIATLNSSCSKDNVSINFNEGVLVADDFVTMENTKTLLLNTYFKAINDSILWNYGVNTIDGATVRLTNDSTVIDINYNSWGNFDGYGHYRSGSYTATTNNDFTSKDSEISILFDNFKFDFDSIVSGNINITNNGTNEDGNKMYSVVNDKFTRYLHDTTLSIFYAYNQDIVYKSASNNSFYSIYDTLELAGEFSGIASNSVSFTGLFDSNLITQFYCPRINGGSSKINASSIEYEIICSFSDNICDQMYIVNINDTEFHRGY